MIAETQTGGHPLAPAAVPAPAAADPGGAETDQQSIFALVRERFQGRWKYAVPLGLVVGSGLAVAGYRTAPVRYKSTGAVTVAARGTPILRETPDTRALNGYDGVVDWQMMLVKTPGVVDQALKDPAVGALPLARAPGARRRITKRLSTRHERNTEYFTVSFEADSAQDAYIVVNAVLRAYDARPAARGGTTTRELRMRHLVENRDIRRATKKVREQAIEDFRAHSDSGGANLDEVVSAKLLHIEELKHEIDRLDVILLTAHAGAEGPDAAVGDGAIPEPTDADLDHFDPGLAALRMDRAQRTVELEKLGQQYGARHPIYKKSLRELDLLNGQIAVREQRARTRWFENGGVLPVAGDQLAALTPEEMSLRRDHLEALREQYQGEVRTLNDERSRLAELEHQLAAAVEALREVDEQIATQHIEADAQFSGRVEVAEWGAMPEEPSTDRRRAMAALGLAGGGAMVFGFFFVLGAVDQRTYSARQLRHRRDDYRCLGVLPRLPSEDGHQALSEAAAQCVHQIRNRLETVRETSVSFALLVTSPHPGDGKTSVAMALAWSYAAGGHRTLLLDCDLTGATLTRQLGYSAHEGLKEVLRNRGLDGQITALSVPNLELLGVGMDPAIGPESVRHDDFATLLDELRERYDVVIMDTGPFLGSIELLPVASAADGVVLSVRRGRARAPMLECIEELRRMNLPLLGVILNFAGQADCDRYTSRSTVPPRRRTGSNGSSSRRSNGSVTFAPRETALAETMGHLLRPPPEREPDEAGVPETVGWPAAPVESP